MTPLRRLRASTSVADGFRETASHRPRLRLVSGASLDRLEAGERVADRGPADPQGLGAVERRPSGLGGSGARRGRRRPPRRDRTGPRRTSRRARRRRRRRVRRARAGRSRAWSRSWRRRSRRRPRRADAAAAPPRRRGRRHSSASTRSSAGGATPASARASPSSAVTSRSRTRSRSSPVAIRVKVTTRSCSGGTPSATSRATRAAIANVFPVPALASSSVTPRGSGPQRSNSRHPARRAHRSISSSRARSPSQSRRAYRPARDGSSSDPALALLVVARPLLEQLGDRPRPAQHEPVLRLRILLREVPVGRPFLLGGSPSVLAGGDRGGVRGRGLAVERQRLAHPALEQVDEHREVRTRLRLPCLRVVGKTDAGDGHLAPLRPVRPAPAERDRLVGRRRARGGEREQVDPRGQPMPRRDAASRSRRRRGRRGRRAPSRPAVRPSGSSTLTSTEALASAAGT